MTTKAYAKPEEQIAAGGDLQGERMCGSRLISVEEQAIEKARVARTAEAIEERLSAMVAAKGAGGHGQHGDPPSGAEERLRHMKNYLKAHARLEARAKIAGAHHSPGTPPRGAPGAQGRAWFEARFGELKGAVERLATANSFAAAEDMTALNARLDDLMGRLDCALESESHETALKSHETALKSLECQLAGLAGYLESTRAWAEERHAKIDVRFEGVEARLDSLGQAVEQSNKAIQNVSELTAAQISEAMRRMPPSPGLIRIERDVRSLSAAAREQEERTAEAVSELHGALRMILDQLASMGEKLSGVGDMLEDARERSGPAEDEVRISTGKGNGESPGKGEGGLRASPAAPGQGTPKGHSQSIAYGQLNKRADYFAASTEQRGSKLALAGALIILAVTGVAIFAHQLRDRGGSDLAGVLQPQIGRVVGSKETASALPKPLENPGGENARTMGQAPAGGDADAISTHQAPLTAASAPPQGVAVVKPVEEARAQDAPDLRAADSFALPPSLGTERIRLAAVAGDPGAQYTVANLYETGQGAARDPASAARWFRRAAEQNHAPSQYRLATLYERGQGVEKDLPAAESLYRSAAGLGNVKAMHNLAVMLVHRQGRSPDYATAAKWFSRAAERGFADSQYNLAILYEQGLGVSRDAEAAYRWFALSARGGDRQAQSQRDRVAGGLTVAAAARVDTELLGWRATAVDAAANKVLLPQEQAAGAQEQAAGAQAQAVGEQLPVGDDGRGPEPRVVEPKPAERRPGAGRQRKVRTEANGEGGDRSRPQMAAAFVNPRNVVAQTNLSQLGYLFGRVDGQIGPRTRRAIRRFQSDHGLAITGEINDLLLESLARAQEKG